MKNWCRRRNPNPNRILYSDRGPWLCQNTLYRSHSWLVAGCWSRKKFHSVALIGKEVIGGYSQEVVGKYPHSMNVGWLPRNWLTFIHSKTDFTPGIFKMPRLHTAHGSAIRKNISTENSRRESSAIKACSQFGQNIPLTGTFSTVFLEERKRS